MAPALSLSARGVVVADQTRVKLDGMAQLDALEIDICSVGEYLDAYGHRIGDGGGIGGVDLVGGAETGAVGALDD